MLEGVLYVDRLPVSGETRSGPYDAVCDEFPEIFTEPGIPPPRKIEHEVHLKDPQAAIPRSRPYRMSPFELDECKR